jgi:flagellar hook protein FlgE
VAISVQGVTLPDDLIGAGASTIVGTSNANATAATDEVAIIGGAISITMDDTVATTNGLVDAAGAAGEVFGIMSQAQFDNNTFNVDDPDTYNHATSMTIYDSLGNAHVMTQYFVKEAPIIVGGRDNIWSLYIQVDGRNVDVNPVGDEASLTRHELAFNSDGSLSTTTESININNWTPANADGTSNGALRPSGVDGTEIGDPPLFSDFVIDVAGTTSFGGPFNVASIDQDGFSTGQLSSLEIADDGTIFARFTNGEARVLGQLLLARFDNSQGLNPTGNTSWTETFESGTPTVARPGTSSLGLIQSGAVEESNVDLSSELVNLILAQRNFQASAKTIETANAITQTIINLR